MCLSGCVCVCGWRAFETRSEKGPADKQTSNKGTFSISSSSVYMPTHKAVGHAGSHSNNKPRPCLPSSSSHLGVLITALNFLLHSRPCPPQTNNLGGRILIIIASEKSDSLFIEVAHWPCRFLSISLSIFLCLLCLMITLSVSHP